MKVLFVHLLRLGDVIMAAPIFAQFQQMYPQAQLDILVNYECRNFAAVSPVPWRNILLFPRAKLQQSLGETRYNLSDAFYQLDALAEVVNNHKYDLIVNFTQNELSARLMSLFQARKKVGWYYSSSGESTMTAPWFQYLNDYYHKPNIELVHFVDVFRQSLGLQYLLEDAEKKQARLPTICVQAFTSDTKKCWDENAWAEALQLFQVLRPHYKIQLLAAPFEVELARHFFAVLERKNVKAELVVCDLVQAKQCLQQAQLLITVDTSIKHLAVLTKTPVIELCAGPSDYRKTGVYQSDCIIVNSSVSPVPGDIIGLLATKRLDQDWQGIQTLAEEFHETLHIRRTERNSQDNWQARNLASI